MLYETTNKPIAIIVKGNPKYIRMKSVRDNANKFYKEIENILINKGYTVEYDDGEPYTRPSINANVWIGHSRGIDRLRFAPSNIKTIELITKDKGINGYSNNDEWGIDPNHYKLSDVDISNLNAL